MIHNSMEDTVQYLLSDLLKKTEFHNVCVCERCMDDIMAYALNQLKPMYCTSDKGKVYGRFSAHDSQNQMDIYRAIINSIDMVSKNKHL